MNLFYFLCLHFIRINIILIIIIIIGIFTDAQILGGEWIPIANWVSEFYIHFHQFEKISNYLNSFIGYGLWRWE